MWVMYALVLINKLRNKLSNQLNLLYSHPTTIHYPIFFHKYSNLLYANMPNIECSIIIFPTTKKKNSKYKLYFIPNIAIINIMLSPSQQQTFFPFQTIFPNQQHKGNIRPICRGYYSSPQLIYFIPTFIVAIVLTILFWTQIFIDGYHIYIGRGLCLYVLYRYLSITFSNPGVALDSTSSLGQNNRFCQTCQIYVNKFTRHCPTCDVCIYGYDHHCIFIGKCVGRANMAEFRQFLCGVFSTMIYALVLAIMMTSNIKTIGTRN